MHPKITVKGTATLYGLFGSSILFIFITIVVVIVGAVIMYFLEKLSFSNVVILSVVTYSYLLFVYFISSYGAVFRFYDDKVECTYPGIFLINKKTYTYEYKDISNIVMQSKGNMYFEIKNSEKAVTVFSKYLRDDALANQIISLVKKNRKVSVDTKGEQQFVQNLGDFIAENEKRKCKTFKTDQGIKPRTYIDGVEVGHIDQDIWMTGRVQKKIVVRDLGGKDLFFVRGTRSESSGKTNYHCELRNTDDQIVAKIDASADYNDWHVLESIKIVSNDMHLEYSFTECRMINSRKPNNEISSYLQGITKIQLGDIVSSKEIPDSFMQVLGGLFYV